MRDKSGSKQLLQDSRVRIGRAIRERRQALGLSLGELAERLGVAISTMSKVETGKIGLSFERMENIGHALDIDYVTLLGEGAPSEPAAGTPRHGTRRSITRPEEGRMVDAGVYLEWYHAADMLHKRFQPIVAEIIVDDIAKYGPFTQHAGEEFNYVLEGELEFHSDVYAPVRLTAGSSIYFDAEMKHAHVRVGEGPCRILGILCPRGEPLQQKPGAPSLRVVQPEDGEGLPAALLTGRVS